MAHEQNSCSSLAFVLVKVNKRSKSVLASTKKQSASKQEENLRHFLQNQQIINSNSNNNQNKIKNDSQHHELFKNQSQFHSIEQENNNLSTYFCPSLSKQLYNLPDFHNKQSNHSPQNLILFERQSELEQFKSQNNNNELKQKTQDDYIQQKNKGNLSNNNNNNNKLSPFQKNNQKTEDVFYPSTHIHMNQTFMKPSQQRSLSFYKQNLQHKREISQKSENNNKLFQIWNDEEFQVKIYPNTNINNNNKIKSEMFSQKQHYEFFPKNTKPRRSYTKLSMINGINGALKKQFMGEEIQLQQQQFNQMNNYKQYQQQQHFDEYNMSKNSSKEELNIGIDMTNYCEQIEFSHKMNSKSSHPDIIHDVTHKIDKNKLNNINKNEKRSKSVIPSDTTKRQSTTNYNNNFNENNSALTKILDAYSQPKVLESYSQPRSSSHNIHIKTNYNNSNNINNNTPFQTNPTSNKNNITNNNNNKIIINKQFQFPLSNSQNQTPIRQNKSFSISNNNNSNNNNKIQFLLSPLKSEQDKLDQNQIHTKVINERQLHFKSIYNKYKQQSNNNTSISPKSSTNKNIKEIKLIQQQNQENMIMTSEMQTAETTTDDNTQTLPYKTANQSFFTATKAKLFYNMANEKSKQTSIELSTIQKQSSPSPQLKKYKKRRIKYTFNRGFTSKDNDIDDCDDINYNLDNYINEERHKL